MHGADGIHYLLVGQHYEAVIIITVMVCSDMTADVCRPLPVGYGDLICEQSTLGPYR